LWEVIWVNKGRGKDAAPSAPCLPRNKLVLGNPASTDRLSKVNAGDQKQCLRAEDHYPWRLHRTWLVPGLVLWYPLCCTGYVDLGYTDPILGQEATNLGLKLSNLKGLDDGALVERIQYDDDRRAFSELVRRHQAVVYRSCYRVLGNREDARDASQEAFLRAYRKLDTFQGRSAFKTWMLRLTMNVSLNQRSRRELSRTSIDSAESISGLETPEAELMKSEAAAQLHEALHFVQPNHRAAVVLRDLEGLTYRETAESLGIAEGTAKSWVHRGRGQLKELLT
jgi:RNA polymerase sigma-70 factor (ECF subfamily)